MNIASEILDCYFIDNKEKLNLRMKRLILENGIDEVESVIRNIQKIETKEIADEIEASFNFVVDKLTR